MRLQDQDEDPIDAGHNAVECEAGVPVAVLVPDAAALMRVCTVCWAIESVVSAWYEDQQPRDNGENLVRQKIARGELLPFGEWVI